MYRDFFYLLITCDLPPPSNKESEISSSLAIILDLWYHFFTTKKNVSRFKSQGGNVWVEIVRKHDVGSRASFQIAYSLL